MYIHTHYLHICLCVCVYVCVFCGPLVVYEKMKCCECGSWCDVLRTLSLSNINKESYSLLNRMFYGTLYG